MQERPSQYFSGPKQITCYCDYNELSEDAYFAEPVHSRLSMQKDRAAVQKGDGTLRLTVPFVVSVVASVLTRFFPDCLNIVRMQNLYHTDLIDATQSHSLWQLHLSLFL